LKTHQRALQPTAKANLIVVGSIDILRWGPTPEQR